MATRRQKIEVGLFLAVALGILVVVLGALIGLGRSQLVTYYIEFQENVAGLAEGSRVTYRGVPVGRITDIVITAQNVVRVTVGIEPRKVCLRQGIQAQLTMESLLGPVAVDLFGGEDRSAPPLKPGTTIPSQPSLRFGIEQSLPAILTDLRSVIKQLDGTLSKLNPEDVGRLLQEFEALLKTTDKTLAELRTQTAAIASSLQRAIQEGTDDVDRASERIVEALGKLEDAIDVATRLVQGVHEVVESNREDVGQAIGHLRNVLAQAEKQLGGVDLPATERTLRDTATKMGDAADGVRQAADTLGRSATTIARSREDFRRSLDNVERSLTDTLKELDRTLESARRLIDYLERDPAALLRGKGEAPKR